MMNMSPVSFKGQIANQIDVARNAGISISDLAEKNPNLIGKEDACNEVFDYGLSRTITEFTRSKTVDNEDCEEATITKDWLKELIEKNQEKQFLPDNILKMCARMITRIDKKIEETKQLFKDL